MAGLCGVVGLVFVNRIATAVSGFVDVTTPLMTQSVVLVENAYRIRSKVRIAIEKGENLGPISRELSDLHAETREQIERLKVLSSRVGLALQFDEIARNESAFHSRLGAIVEASARARAAAAAVQERQAAFEARHHSLQRALVSLTDRAEAAMAKAEDEAKVQVQTRTATVDGLGDRLSDFLNGTYPVVQNANKLLRAIEQIDDPTHLLAQATPEQLSSIEEGFTRSFRVAAPISEKLANSLRDAEGQATLASVQQNLVEIESIILGAGGLVQSRRDEAMAKADLDTGRELLRQAGATYLAVIKDVDNGVRDLTQTAKAATDDEIARARTITGISALLTLVVAVLFSLVFAHRLTAPLVRLAAQVRDVRASGELKVLPRDSFAGRSDEIGSLSRGFNLMIADLATARAELIARSDAAISKQYERLSLAINSMAQGLCMFDADQKLIICNKRFAEMYSLAPKFTAPGTSLRSILEHREATNIGADYIKDYAENRLREIRDGKPGTVVHKLRDGRTIAILHVALAGGGSLATHEDISERRESEAKITFMAHHDMLTKLPNRGTFRDDMKKAVADLRDMTVAVLCLDLDYFKNVNDTLGHPVGDALLKAVAARLELCVRPSDKVARLGGDEFAVVQTGVAQPNGSTALAARLIKEMAEPFTVDDHQVVIGVSIGISLAPNDGRDADRLLKNADMALYRAKEDGRGTYRFFEPDMDARMQARRTLEIDMRKALVLGEFLLNYQPLVNVKTREINSCEALLRWRHPVRGMIPPLEFIPLAEEIGFINQLGLWVLNQACAEARNWPDRIKLSVNLSVVQFKSGTLVADVAAALKSSGMAANRLELEITESVLLNETDATLATLNQLHDLGVHISMDDFGTGYSSLGYLRKFPFDKIKIDQSFIRDLASNPESIAIVRAVAGLANTLGITTTAEGVETEAQLQQVTKEGCTEAQGYLFSKPVTADALLPLLAHRGPGFKAVA
jgi:diguanylate cyclase (GGDEF)-like protein